MNILFLFLFNLKIQIYILIANIKSISKMFCIYGVMLPVTPTLLTFTIILVLMLLCLWEGACTLVGDNTFWIFVGC